MSRAGVPNPQSSSLNDDCDVDTTAGEDFCPKLSNPSHAEDVWTGAALCERCNFSILSRSALAARSAIVICEAGLEANVPDKRLLNASPDEAELVGGGPGGETVFDAGVIERDPGAEEPADESMEKTSFCGRRTPWLDIEEYDPSF